MVLAVIKVVETIPRGQVANNVKGDKAEPPGDIDGLTLGAKVGFLDQLGDVQRDDGPVLTV